MVFCFGLSWPFGELSVLFLFVILYNRSVLFRFAARYLVLLFVFLLAGVLAMLQAFYRPCSVSNGVRLAAPMRLASWALAIRWHVRGGHQLRGDFGAVVVANHQSALDVIGVAELWPLMGRISTVVKRELWFVGFPLAMCGWLCGQIFIDRSNPTEAKKRLNLVAGRLGKDNLKLWIFPEGTRGDSGTTLLPFKKGAFHLAVDGQVPVIPVVFSSYRPFLNWEKWLFDSGDIIIQVLPPIDTKGLTSEDVPALLKQTRSLMQHTYEDISQQLSVDGPPSH